MKFEEISKAEYLNFAENNKYISIYQYPEWGELKKCNGWDYYLVALKDSGKVVGETLLLRKKIIVGHYLFYAPRGFLIDSTNMNLLTTFQNYITKFIKEKHGFMLKIDPNVIYNLRDKEGEILSNLGKLELDNYLKLGYKHLGFTFNFETMQPRFLCRYKIQATYEETFKTFIKSTQKNTQKAFNMGVRCESIGPDKIDLFVEMLNKTAIDKHFVLRPTWYYKKMLELFPNNLLYYLTYIDTNIYHNFVNTSLKNAVDDVKIIEEKIKKYANTGEKIKHELDLAKSAVLKYKNDLNEAINLKKLGDKVYVGALMSVFTGNEGITFMSGTDNAYKKFNIKYAFYDAHLKESIKRKKEYVNYYGISGDMNKNSEFYNIYDLKKGYNPEILELLGEFDLILSKPKYVSYNFMLKVYKKIKKFKH